MEPHMKNQITQDILKYLFDYDENSGRFTHKEISGRHPNRNVRFSGKFADCVLDKDGYRKLSAKEIGSVRAHRMAWIYYYGEQPPEIIDHINGDPADNKIKNLRAASKNQNRWNSTHQNRNKLSQRGISLNGKNGFRVRVTVNGQYHYIGRFKTLEEAIKRRDEAHKTLYGAYAKLPEELPPETPQNMIDDE
jgi:hypothetical protein